MEFGRSGEENSHFNHESMVDEFDRLNEEAFAIAHAILNSSDSTTVHDLEAEYEEKLGEIVGQFEDITIAMLMRGDILGWISFVRSNEVLRYSNMKKLGYDKEPYMTDEEELREQAERFIEAIPERAVRAATDSESIIRFEHLDINESNDTYGDLAIYRNAGNLIDDMYRLIEKVEDNDAVDQAESFLRSIHINPVDTMDDKTVREKFQRLTQPKLDTDKLFRSSYAMLVREKREPMGPIAERLMALDNARQDFINARHAMVYEIRSNKKRSTRKLIDKLEKMSQALESMLDAIAAHNRPEEAVTMIMNVLREHDSKLRASLGIAARKPQEEWMEKISEDLLRDYAISYADPRGLTLALSDADTRPVMFMDRIQVIHSINDKIYQELSKSLEHIPKDYYQAQEEQNNKRNSRKAMLGKAAAAVVIAGGVFAKLRKFRS